MKLVLLSGGSGKRLWPLSNDSRSKQFLRVLQGDTGELESMVERVWRQLGSAGLSGSVYIATGIAQVDMIQNQLGLEVPLIIEPERRDTYPAIALAASYLHTVAQVDPEEVVVVLPVDPFVQEDFFLKVKELETALAVSGADLALMGVKPTFPSEKYGYIVPRQRDQDGLSEVECFTEKPDQETARELLERGAFWNCGVFAFRLRYLLEHLAKEGISPDYADLLDVYARLPKTSFDYAVVEKARRVVVLPYVGEWKDLGTWNTLTEEMSVKVLGKGICCEESVNTHLVNELDIPVTVLGLSNIIVAASPDGILVADKAASPRIKDLIGDLNQRPMYEERRWGWYRVLEHTTYPDGTEVLTKRIAVSPGKNLSYQYHHLRSEVWTMTRGEGEFALDGMIYLVQAGDVLRIPIGVKHGIKAHTELEFIEVQAGGDLVEEDIIRVCVSWDEVERACRRGTERPSLEVRQA